MFSKKNDGSQIDPLQREMYEHARTRILQKKRLFQHFIVFIVGAIFLIMLNLLFGLGKAYTFFGLAWCFSVIIGWGFLLALHFCNVWLFHSFMGQEWTNKQMERLIAKQKEELVLIQRDVDRMYPKDELLEKKEAFIKEKQANLKAIDQPTVRAITMIAAAGENNELGKDNTLVWHLPDDFKRFKKLTTGHHIIMGRKTFESFPKLLPNRVHIVITRNEDYKADGAIVVHHIEKALEICKSDENPFIIGGGEIYTLGLQVANCIELTRVHHTFEADAFFPEIDTNTWELVKEEFHDIDEKHQYPFTYLTYKKK